MNKEKIKQHIEVNVGLCVDVDLIFHESGRESSIDYEDFRSVRKDGDKTIITYWTNDDDYPEESFAVTETVEEVKEIVKAAEDMIRKANKEYKIVRVKWSK